MVSGVSLIPRPQPNQWYRVCVSLIARPQPSQWYRVCVSLIPRPQPKFYLAAVSVLSRGGVGTTFFWTPLMTTFLTSPTGLPSYLSNGMCLLFDIVHSLASSSFVEELTDERSLIPRSLPVWCGRRAWGWGLGQLSAVSLVSKVHNSDLLKLHLAQHIVSDLQFGRMATLTELTQTYFHLPMEIRHHYLDCVCGINCFLTVLSLNLRPRVTTLPHDFHLNITWLSHDSSSVYLITSHIILLHGNIQNPI